MVVDRGERWGGQWPEQYDYVRLHQVSARASPAPLYIRAVAGGRASWQGVAPGRRRQVTGVRLTHSWHTGSLTGPSPPASGPGRSRAASPPATSRARPRSSRTSRTSLLRASLVTFSSDTQIACCTNDLVDHAPRRCVAERSLRLEMLFCYEYRGHEEDGDGVRAPPGTFLSTNLSKSANSDACPRTPHDILICPQCL